MYVLIAAELTFDETYRYLWFTRKLELPSNAEVEITYMGEYIIRILCVL